MKLGTHTWSRSLRKDCSCFSCLALYLPLSFNTSISPLRTPELLPFLVLYLPIQCPSACVVYYLIWHLYWRHVKHYLHTCRYCDSCCDQKFNRYNNLLWDTLLQQFLRHCLLSASNGERSNILCDFFHIQAVYVLELH